MSAFRTVAVAAALIHACCAAASATDPHGALAFVAQEKTEQDKTGPEKTADPQTTGSIPPAKSGEMAARDGGGRIQKQTASVSTQCLQPELTKLIDAAAAHFGSPAVITSGYRRGRHSFHGRCMAADVQIAGVNPGALARYFRGQHGVGGVGTYGHTRSVHVDVAPRRFSWHHGGRSKRYTRLARA